MNRDRASSHPGDTGKKGNDITNIDRRGKVELFDADGNDLAGGAAIGQYGAGNIGMRHQPAPEDVAEPIGVVRHGHHAYGRLAHVRAQQSVFCGRLAQSSQAASAGESLAQ